jgi:glycerophosphoryl diester phosphodiesterase
MPENTLPSFADAVALGADEIEFDVRLTADNEMIVCHDLDVGAVSDKKGELSAYTLAELRRMNAGSYKNWYVPFTTPEEVISAFAGRAVLNIHIHDFGENMDVPARLRRLLYRNDCTDYAYFAARDEQLALCLRFAPDIVRCSLAPRENGGADIIDYAVKYACRRVQFRKPYFNPAAIARAKSYGMEVAVCWADDRYEAKRLLDMGVDTILTNRTDVLTALRDGR